MYLQVTDGGADHSRWERPEDGRRMNRLYKIDANNGGTEVAAETSAALSAASIVFSRINPSYSKLLMRHARELYEFADEKRLVKVV